VNGQKSVQRRMVAKSVQGRLNSSPSGQGGADKQEGGFTTVQGHRNRSRGQHNRPHVASISGGSAQNLNGDNKNQINGGDGRSGITGSRFAILEENAGNSGDHEIVTNKDKEQVSDYPNNRPRNRLKFKNRENVVISGSASNLYSMDHDGSGIGEELMT